LSLRWSPHALPQRAWQSRTVIHTSRQLTEGPFEGKICCQSFRSSLPRDQENVPFMQQDDEALPPSGSIFSQRQSSSGCVQLDRSTAYKSFLIWPTNEPHAMKKGGQAKKPAREPKVQRANEKPRSPRDEGSRRSLVLAFLVLSWIISDPEKLQAERWTPSYATDRWIARKDLNQLP
jgi:hypothetical protein